MFVEEPNPREALALLLRTPGWRVLKQALTEKIEDSQRRLSTAKPESADAAYRLLMEEQAKQGVWRKLLTDLENYGLPEGAK